MDDVRSQPEPQPTPQSAGDALKAARLAKGLSMADVGAATRVPTRHLEAIETSDYASLPSATYAVGFAKAYARAVGLDEVSIGQRVRADVDRIGPRTSDYQPYDIVDPSRVPSRGVAIVAAGIALALIVLAALWFGTNMFARAPQGERAAPAGPVAPVRQAEPTPAARVDPAGGQVTLVAKGEVWLRVYDAANKTLFLGTMKPGDRFDVPRDADDPKINVGRPDLLAITLNGAAIAPLGTGERPIKDVPVSTAAIAARASGAPPATAPSPMPTATPRAAPSRPARATATRSTDGGGRHAARSALTETQRANLASAANPSPPAAATPR